MLELESDPAGQQRDDEVVEADALACRFSCEQTMQLGRHPDVEGSAVVLTHGTADSTMMCMETKSIYRPGSFSSGHVTAPARKSCPCCHRPNILLNKRSTFGLAYSGRPICSRCLQTDAERY